MSRGARFERIELRYGRHATAFDLGRDRPSPGHRSPESAPFVILGPNGAGKSTLVEALMRTLFGFRRVSPSERGVHDLRRPWRGGGYGARVRILTPEGGVTFERDFDSDLVRVTRDGLEGPLFEEEANPARAGESMRRYRELLGRTIGLTELEAYQRTACVFQGGLIGTGLSLDLLRVAAGGHADVETARTRLTEEYRRLTVEPIADDASRRRKPGALERTREEVADLEARLREARAAERRRRPLVRARDEIRGRLDTLAGEIERLETAFETLSEGTRLDMEAEASRGRIRALDTAARDVDEALARLELLSSQTEGGDVARYPSDFGARADMLDMALWPRVSRIDEELARLAADVASRRGSALGRPMLIGCVIACLAGAVALLAGWALVGLPLVFGGALAAGVVGVAERAARARVVEHDRRVEELSLERRETEERIRTLAEGVPDPDSLGPGTLAGHRREFERQRRDRELLDDAEARLRRSMDQAARTLSELEAAHDGEEPTSTDRAVSRAGGVRDRARDLLRALRDRVDRERDDVMGPLKFRLGELARSRFQLPPDVDATLDAVRRARRSRLADSDGLRRELADVERDLALETRQDESAIAIERELETKRERVLGLAERAEAYRRANALIRGAYEAFRRTDEERLVAAISGHLVDLSGGELGPLEADDGLERATVRVGEKALPLDSPPLSYGQLHAALLAIRIGAADFLAGLGVRVPLLIDDPFVHLDERSAADLWRVLERIATDRQVIIATQDRLVLEHLGVRADLELRGPRTGAAPPAGARETGEGPGQGGSMPAREPATAGRGAPDESPGAESVAEEAVEGEPGGEHRAPLDLWSQADV